MTAPLALPRTPLGNRWLVLCIAVICAIECWALHGVRHDDAFITLRYAENLARGAGPVFNPGERVLGTTAPGHMLLGALLYGLCGKAAFPSAMAVLGCVGWAAQALAVFALLRTAFGTAPSVCASLAVALGAAESASFIALETNLAVAGVLWSMVFAQHERWLWAAVLAAAAGLVRPDAYLPALLVGAWGLYEARRALLVPIAAFCAITLPWQLFALVYYGSPLPQPARTKPGTAPFVDYVTHELWEPMRTLFPWTMSAWMYVLGCLLVVLGAVLWVRRTPRAFILPAYGVAHFAAYAWLRPPIEHTWHVYPLRLVLVILALATFATGYERLEARSARMGMGLVVALLLLAYADRTSAFARSHATAYWFGARDAAYVEAADYLRRHARPGDVVAAIEVGTVGYYSELRMYDWSGLITPQPLLRPLDPEVRWIVNDPGYGGLLPVRVFDPLGFKVLVYNTQWMRSAMQAAMARLPGRSEQQILTQHRDVLARELGAIVRAREKP